jgi:hypothetical protein
MYSPEFTGNGFFGGYDTRVGVAAAGYSQDLPGYRQKAPGNQANNQRKDTMGLGNLSPSNASRLLSQL